MRSADPLLVFGRRGHLSPQDDAKRASALIGLGRRLERFALVALERGWRRRRGDAFAPGERLLARRQQPLKALGIVFGTSFAQLPGIGAQHRALVGSRVET
jgi:hypothetical protein